MPVRFDAAADRALLTSGLFDYNAAYTICFWFNFPSNPANNTYSTLVAANRNSTTLSFDGLTLNRNTSNNRLLAYADNNGTYAETRGTANLTAGTNYFAALVRSSASQLLAYLDGTLDLTVNHSSFSARSAQTRLELGGFGTGNADPFNGNIGPVKIWTAALTAAQIAQERLTVQPVRIENLWRWSLLGNDLNDSYGGWTAGGSLTYENKAPISY